MQWEELEQALRMRREGRRRERAVLARIVAALGLVLVLVLVAARAS